MQLIVGASGAVGIPTIRHLVQLGQDLRALSSSEASAERLRALGVGEVVVGSYRDDGEIERAILDQLADPVQVLEGDKHYVVRTAPAESREIEYPASLPVSIDPATDLGRSFEIPFVVADDLESSDPTVSRVTAVELRVCIRDLTLADRVEIRLNGTSLAGETVHRRVPDPIVPYAAQRLDIELRNQRPHAGSNLLEIVLLERPKDLVSPLCIESVEVLVRYGTYPSTALV